MLITDITWLPNIVDKLAWKHNVLPSEVDEVLFSNPHFRRVQKGHRPGEDLYAALGRTDAGRYLIVFFVYKQTQDALIVSARDMTKGEKRRYGQ